MLQRIRSSFWTPAAAILQSRHCTRPGSLQQPPGDRRGVSGLPGSPAGRGGRRCTHVLGAALTCSPGPTVRTVFTRGFLPHILQKMPPIKSSDLI